MQEIIRKIYENEENIFVEDIHMGGNKCYVFFSSNGLLKSFKECDIEEELVKRNRYEWKSIAETFKYHRDLGRIIYVRDVYLAFYIYGINKSLDTVDKIIEKIAQLCKGYEITTVGISSGGYLATICAIKLNAKRAFNFSGQYDIWERLDETTKKYCVSKYGNYGYVNICDLVEMSNGIPIFYFCPVGCSHDFANYQLVRNIPQVKCFLFPDKNHAATVYPFNFPDLLFLSNDKLEWLCKKYEGKTIDKKRFYFHTVTIRGLITLGKYIKRSKFHVSKLKQKWSI